MIADYTFYTNVYLGTKIPSNKYNFFGERASDKLARYEAVLPQAENVQTSLKKCACAIAEMLYNADLSSKNGQKVTSESVQGYYSVSFSVEDETALKSKINGVIRDYLGGYLFRRAVVIY